jgi:hypothetical protein
MRQLWDLHSLGRVNSLANYNLLMFLLIYHKRFLMRQYKFKCLHMPYRFLLIFFPLDFKGVLSISYCTLCNIYRRYMSYLLFFSIGVSRRKYTWNICYSLNSLMRFSLFKVFLIWDVKEITINIYVSFSPSFSHWVLWSFNNISNNILLKFFPRGFWGKKF